MAKLGTKQPVRTQLLDYSNERASLTIYAGELTALSLAGFLTDLTAWNTAVSAVTLGTVSEREWGALSVVSNSRPSDKNAQVETQMLVTYRGVTTQESFSFRIPTVDYSVFNYVGDEVILSGDGASENTTAFITAFETIARNPNDDSESVEITSMRVVR